MARALVFCKQCIVHFFLAKNHLREPSFLKLQSESLGHWHNCSSGVDGNVYYLRWSC